jgi:hypothetical protein
MWGLISTYQFRRFCAIDIWTIVFTDSSEYGSMMTSACRVDGVSSSHREKEDFIIIYATKVGKQSPYAHTVCL